MTQPKRVWSNKKTVWEWKKWVWLQDGELKTYDWTREKADWQLSTYDNSWENLSGSDKLEVFDSADATEIGTVDENQWWGSTGVTITGISADYLEIPQGDFTSFIAFYTPDSWNTDNITVSSDSEDISAYMAGASNWEYVITVESHSDDASAIVSVSDWTNTFTCEVQCIPLIAIESIGNPSISEATLTSGKNAYVTFSYYPADATYPWSDIAVDTNNIGFSGIDYFEWTAYMTLFPWEEVWSGYFSYYLYSNPEDVKTVTTNTISPAWIESLTWVPQNVEGLSVNSSRSYEVTYSPTDADYIAEQISIETSDPSIARAWIRNVDTTNHTFIIDYSGWGEGSAYIYFYANWFMLGETYVEVVAEPEPTVNP